MARRPSKYHAIVTEVDGIRFHSRKESRRYQELKLLEKAGEIRGLTLQPRYALTAANCAIGEVYTIGHYVGDFQYEERVPLGGNIGWEYTTKGVHVAWRRVVEDCKGGEATKTAIYRWKIKHLKAEHGIDVRET